ncbi:Membrane associated serine protease, rhomboid family [Robiginitalea myxolifaciens]|uniref:Membrane associated serine protease, rhomboid family n=1 Tax=Robiginitalea myxolifaciens TaxID=400055 RepID=A0A1I6HI66_9FLAO|nr:Membrane associated serine protease, rhomboid family [Robiginitalea myxolifaciens]
MSPGPDAKPNLRLLLLPLFLVLVIWVVFMMELRVGSNFSRWGVYPRTLEGLRGILFSPFIHGSTTHLYNNTLPLFVLSAVLLYFYPRSTFKVLVIGGLLSGLLTWIIGRPSYHIGASGIIYLLASFIFFRGIISRHYRLVALSLIVVFIYGSMVWYVFPIQDGISWEGHLAGAVSGLLLALLLRHEVPEKPKYTWESEDYREEDDPFMRQFDADGNFIDSRELEQEQEPASPEDGSGEQHDPGRPALRVRYSYKPKNSPYKPKNTPDNSGEQ